MIAKTSALLNAATVVAVVGVSALVVACSSMSGVTSATGPCLDDSKACIDSRTATVASLVNDPSRAWVGQPVDKRMAASGIRLFAYQTVMDGLDCPKLLAGVREMQAARSALSGGASSGQTAERHNQIRALTADTEAQLAGKARKRGCKA